VIKVLQWITLCLLLLSVPYFLVLLLDAGVALDDARSQVTYLRQRSDLALSIVRKDWIGKDAASIAKLSKELERQGVPVRVEEEAYEIGDVIFQSKGGLVTEVRYFD